MMMRDHFANFIKYVYPDKVPNIEQLREVERAFYAGGIAYFNIVSRFGENTEEEELATLMTEMKIFNEMVKVGLK